MRVDGDRARLDYLGIMGRLIQKIKHAKPHGSFLSGRFLPLLINALPSTGFTGTAGTEGPLWLLPSKCRSPGLEMVEMAMRGCLHAHVIHLIYVCQTSVSSYWTIIVADMWCQGPPEPRTDGADSYGHRIFK